MPKEQKEIYDYNNNWVKNNRVRVSLVYDPKERIKERIKALTDISVNNFIIEATLEKIRALEVDKYRIKPQEQKSKTPINTAKKEEPAMDPSSIPEEDFKEDIEYVKDPEASGVPWV